MTPSSRTPVADASTGELIAQATSDISTLIRDEMQLAKRDLAESGKRLGIGLGLLGASGIIALYGIGALVATAILGLAQVVDGWLAALVVAVILFLVAGIAALLGKRSAGRMAEPPQQRVESVKADVATAKHGSGEGDDA